MVWKTAPRPRKLLCIARKSRKDTFTKVCEATGPRRGNAAKTSPRPGTSRRQGQPQQPGTAPAFGRQRSHSPTISLQPGVGSPVRASPRGKPPATRARAPRSSCLRRRAFPELRSLPARAEVVRLTWPGCGAARREEHLHRPQTRGASLGGFVAGPDRGRARAVWGAFGRAESGRRRRGRSRGDQAQKRTTPTRSVVRSSASLPLRRPLSGNPGRSPRAATGACEALAALWPAGTSQRGARSCGRCLCPSSEPAGRCHRNGLARAAEAPGGGGRGEA